MRDFATEVVRMAEAIALRLGTEENFYSVYRDGKVQIRRALHSQEMEIVIFPPFTGATTGNPVLMVDAKGKLFRWHGEIYNARAHFQEIYQRLQGTK